MDREADKGCGDMSIADGMTEVISNSVAAKDAKVSKTIGDYEIIYHFSGTSTLEDCVSDYIRKKLKN